MADNRQDCPLNKKEEGKKDNSFLARKNINISLKTYLIDAMGAMAFGLFASLLIGTIFNAVGDWTKVEFFKTAAGYAVQVSGAAIGIAIATAAHITSMLSVCESR